MNSIQLITRIFSMVLTTGIILMIVVGCGKKTGATIGAAQVEPPVTANIPSGFLATLSIQAADTTMGILNQRFFSSGPTEIRSLLSSIDLRILELNQREAEFHRTCLDESPTLFTISTPFSLGLPHYLSCVDDISETQWLAFGQKDSSWYLREGQSQGFLTLAKIDENSNVEAWIAVSDVDTVNSTSQMILHLKSTAATHRLELSVTGSNIGVGCGVQYQSDENYIYVSGLIDDPSGGAGADCSTVVPSAVCAEATGLSSVATSNCTAAGLDSFALSAIDYSTHPYNQINTLGQQTLSGLSAF
jgi:hypothetical protein